MSKPVLYIFTKSRKRQAILVSEICRELNIKSQIINIFELKTDISLTFENIFINNKKISKNAILYQIGIDAAYLNNFDCDYEITNFTYFQDFQPIIEQNLSQLMSLFNIASKMEKIYVINNPFENFNLQSRLFQYRLLRKIGFDVPDYILTNSLNEILESEIYKLNQSIIWSYHTYNSPFKSLKKENISKLFSENRSLPFMFYSQVEGIEIRAWFLDSIPLMMCKVIKPFYDINSKDMLEKYEYYKPVSRLIEIGNKLFPLFKGFYEIRGIIKNDGSFYFYNIDISPDFSILGEKGRKFLAADLLINAMKNVGINIENKYLLPDMESRDSIFLGKMNEALFAAEEIN